MAIQSTSPLLAQIQQNLAKMAQPTAAPGQGVLGSTEAIARAAEAATGTAAPAGGTEGLPGRSRQGERAVVDQVKRGQEELAKQANIQNMALAQQQQAIQESENFKNRQLSEEQLNTRDRFLQTQQNILQDYTMGKRQLDLNKDKSRLEQLGFTMRLNNDKYMNELERQAKIANLSDAVSFEEELYRTIFAQEEELLRGDLDFRAALAADDRTFKEELSQMSLDMAISLANAENKALSERQMWESISEIGSTAGKAYSEGLFGSGKSGYTGLGGYQDSRTAPPSFESSSGEKMA